MSPEIDLPARQDLGTVTDGLVVELEENIRPDILVSSVLRIFAVAEPPLYFL